MEKLIELLNEYNGQESYRLDEDSISGEKYINRGDGYQCNVDEKIISKKFGFIKWLVDNDKIDLEEYNNKSGLYTLKVVCGTDYFIYLKTNKVNSDFLLMQLAIQDSPVEFLCEILR